MANRISRYTYPGDGNTDNGISQSSALQNGVSQGDISIEEEFGLIKNMDKLTISVNSRP
jgi:hypothetical protein